MNDKTSKDPVKWSNCNAVLPLDEAVEDQDGRLVVVCSNCGMEETIILTDPLIPPDPES